MSRAAIRIEGVSKQYVLGGPQARYRTLGDALREAAAAPARGLRRLTGREAAPDRFWALQDVTCDVPEGEVTGIIGVNGAGKSTLLKILSRITEPTRGQFRVRGRIASLLEVGTGFHGELSGRENIFLNGAVLGMRRAEIQQKLDEIIAFAGVERFVDTPVKRYSSGMYLRLAFAVAAHLEPEILLVDEVLAVGDMQFQRKCLRRMREVTEGGRTVMLVSHNLAAIESLCSQCLLLDAGRVVALGPVRDVTREYRRRLNVEEGASEVCFDGVDTPERRQRILRGARLLDDEGQPTGSVPLGGVLDARIRIDWPGHPEDATFVVRVEDRDGHRLLTLRNAAPVAGLEGCPGPVEIACRVPYFPLVPGDYWLGFAAFRDKELLDEVDRALRFTVVRADAFGDGRGAPRGICVAPSEWVAAPSGSLLEVSTPA